MMFGRLKATERLTETQIACDIKGCEIVPIPNIDLYEEGWYTFAECTPALSKLDLKMRG